MKKLISAILLGLSILAGGFLIARGAVNCGQVFPTSLNGYVSNCIVGSAIFNAYEAKMGVNGSTATSSLDYQINHIFTSYSSEVIASASLPWLNYSTASLPSSTWILSSTPEVNFFNGATGTTQYSVGSTNSFISAATSTTSTQLTFSSSSLNLTSAATMSLPVSIANGGTATSTVPTNGQFLGVSSSIPTWKTFVAGNNISITNNSTSTQISAISSSTAAGTEGQIQYNEGGTFAGTSTLLYATSTQTLSVPNITVTGIITGGENYFGNGSNGSTTINTTTTLSSDMYYTNLTVNATLITGGYRIFVNGTLTGNGSGTIMAPTPNNGSAGSGVTLGAGGAASINGYFTNYAGGAGSTGTNGSPANASNGLIASSTIGVPSIAGGNGGNGGGGTPGNGGTSPATSTATLFSLTQNSAFYTTQMWDVYSIFPLEARVIESNGGGGGGGGGSGNGGTNVGGGGGGGAASTVPVFIAARVWAGTFTIADPGAKGGNGGNAGGSFGGGGGGGGASSGGTTIVVYGTKTWIGSYNVAGGTSGTGGTATGGEGAGSTPANGSTGNSIEISAFGLP